MSIKIPVYQPCLDGKEKEYVLDCLESNWISSRGAYIKRFEDAFSSYLGIQHSISVSNATVGLHLALVTLGIGEGDEVIVPTFTYIASVSTISQTGARPVFVDSLFPTWQMDPEQVKKKITPRTKAIMAVHLYGHPCDMDALTAIAKEAGIFLIEDCAEAMGSQFQDKNVGTFGDISVFSFFGNKTITTGEGGMLVTNNETLWEKAYHYRMHGLAKYREYWHDVLGYNYRMTNICAAIGLAQLENIAEKIARKRKLAFSYMEKLKDVPVTFHSETEKVFHTFWMVSILTETPAEREELRTFLQHEGIETRPTFYPVHTMPMFSQKYMKMPVAEILGHNGINLPSFPALTGEQLDEICAIIRSYFATK